MRQESDVDICVCCTNPFFVDFTQAKYGSVQGQIDPTYTFDDFKNDVEAALKQKCGTDGYKRGSKAFNVHPNGYRVHADVVAALEYREYLRGEVNPATGVAVATYTKPTGAKFICDSSYPKVAGYFRSLSSQNCSFSLRHGNNDPLASEEHK